VSVGQSKDLSITIKNTGTDALTVSSITSNHAAFVPQQTQATVGAQQSVNVAIRFSPSSVGDFPASIVVTSNSPSSPDTIRVGGSGVIASGVEQLEGIPTEFSLSQNFPNPFNPVTQIRYAVPHDSRVRLQIFNLLGQLVSTLVDEQQAPAYYQVRWDASRMASGIYVYRIQAGDFMQSNKLVLLK
jgi:hypothetical protein